MDLLSNKAVLIGTGLLITLVIMSAVILGINKIGEIYGFTKKTDVNLAKEFSSEFEMYNGAVMNGIDLLNTIKKYENSNMVSVRYPGDVEVKDKAKNSGTREVDALKSMMETENEKSDSVAVNRYEAEYMVNVGYIDSGPKIKIIFTEKK